MESNLACQWHDIDDDGHAVWRVGRVLGWVVFDGDNVCITLSLQIGNNGCLVRKL